MLVGKNGTGKTHISAAIANELIKDKVPVIFGTLTDLLNKCGESYGKNSKYSEYKIMDLYTKVDLLIIDDLGMERMNEWMLSKLFYIVNGRLLRELPIIITTNYELDNLRKRLSNPNKNCETTNSIISRLYSMCYRVECLVEDFRIKAGDENE